MTTDDATPTADAADTPELENMTRAVIFALLTANEQPYPIPAPAARNIALRLMECGVQQTGEMVTEIELPGWVTERVREEAAPVPADPDHHAMQDTDRVVTAPAAPPRRLPQKLMGVIEDAAL